MKQIMNPLIRSSSNISAPQQRRLSSLDKEKLIYNNNDKVPSMVSSFDQNCDNYYLVCFIKNFFV